MDRSPVRDLIVGLFVVAGLAAIAYLSISIGGFAWHGKEGLKLHIYFNEVAGLNVRAPVVIAGVQVGEVTAINLKDKDHNGLYQAEVDIDVDRDLKLTTDTIASVYTSGMLGDRYISLQSGGEDTQLKNNGVITHTESGMILEKILGSIVYGITKDSSKSDSQNSPGGSPKPGVPK